MMNRVSLYIILLTFFACTQNSTNNVESEISAFESRFMIDPSRDTTVIGSQGTRVFVPQYSFIDSDSILVEEEFELLMIEEIEKSINSKDQKQLISYSMMDGTVTLSAWKNNEELELSFENYLVLHVPKSNEQRKTICYRASADGENESWTKLKYSKHRQILQLGMWGYTWINEQDSTPFTFKVREGARFTERSMSYYINSFTVSDETTAFLMTEPLRVGFTVNKMGFCERPVIDENVPKAVRDELRFFIIGLPRFESPRNKNGIAVSQKCRLGFMGTQSLPAYHTNAEYFRSLSDFEGESFESFYDVNLKYAVAQIEELGRYKFLPVEEGTIALR